MIEVPDNFLLIIPEHEAFKDAYKEILHPLSNERKRDWMIRHAYFCLPLVIGNQYGIAIKSMMTFDATWDGGQNPDSVKINVIDDGSIIDGHKVQFIQSHFGMGTITVQNRFSFRTPKGVNLMTMNPPNYFIDGVNHLTGVVETDNLRRDFTFNMKLTCPGKTVRINKGDWIGCVLPVPRYFQDNFKIVSGYDVLSEDELLAEQKSAADFGAERIGPDQEKPHRNGRRYMKGEDVYGNKFDDHQTKVKRPS